MITVVLLNIVVVFFAYLESRKIFEHGLKVSFFFIFIFLAIRYNYGNDYSNYEYGFNDANKFALLSIFDKNLQFEPGWILLCRLFQPVGFAGLVAVLALFEIIVYYYLIKKYVPRSYYWLAVFLYVFNVGLMLVHLSAMRQAIAIGIFILSFEYLFNKKIIKYCLCIGFAAFFHTSAILMLPFFLIMYFDWKINRWVAAIFFALFVALFLFGDSLFPLISKLINGTFEKYEVYQDNSKLSSGVGLVVNGTLLIFVLNYARFVQRRNAIFFKMVAFFFLFLPMGLILIIIQRVSMYLTPAIIPVYPMILILIKKPFVRYMLGMLIILFTLYNFIQFFNSDIWRDAYKTYQTIFS